MPGRLPTSSSSAVPLLSESVYARRQEGRKEGRKEGLPFPVRPSVTLISICGRSNKYLQEREEARQAAGRGAREIGPENERASERASARTATEGEREAAESSEERYARTDEA